MLTFNVVYTVTNVPGPHSAILECETSDVHSVKQVLQDKLSQMKDYKDRPVKLKQLVSMVQVPDSRIS